MIISSDSFLIEKDVALVSSLIAAAEMKTIIEHMSFGMAILTSIFAITVAESDEGAELELSLGSKRS